MPSLRRGCSSLQDPTITTVAKCCSAPPTPGAMLLYIITNAVLFSFLMTSEGIPHWQMAEWMFGQALGVVAFLLITNVLLLVAGNFMRNAPSIVPDHGADPLPGGPPSWASTRCILGIPMVVNMEVGMPPSGGTQPLCNPPASPRWHYRAHRRGVAMVAPCSVSLLLVTYRPRLVPVVPHQLGML